MDEEKWNNSKRVSRLFDIMESHVSDRKLRHLISCISMNLVGKVEGVASDEVIEIFDQFECGLITRKNFDKCIVNYEQSCKVFEIFGFPFCDSTISRSMYDDAKETALWSFRPYMPDVAHIEFDVVNRIIGASKKSSPARMHESYLLELIREIVGNPFQHVEISEKLVSSTSARIAASIYEECAFDRLPILADALQESGVENADVLNHLRSVRSHVRGCWVLNLILGKK